MGRIYFSVSGMPIPDRDFFMGGQEKSPTTHRSWQLRGEHISTQRERHVEQADDIRSISVSGTDREFFKGGQENSLTALRSSQLRGDHISTERETCGIGPIISGLFLYPVCLYQIRRLAEIFYSVGTGIFFICKHLKFAKLKDVQKKQALLIRLQSKYITTFFSHLL